MTALFAGEVDDVSYLPVPLTFAEWQQKLSVLERLTVSLPWWIGDLLLYGQEHFGEQYSQALPDLPYKQEYLYQCHYLARMFPRERRRAGLSWSHHVCVMSLPSQEQDDLLEKAEVEQWTVRDLRRQVKLLKLPENSRPFPALCDWFQSIPDRAIQLARDHGGEWDEERLIDGQQIHLHLAVQWVDAPPE